jgi:hypothetical protein
MDMEMKDPGRQVSPAARKKRTKVPSPELQYKTKRQNGEVQRQKLQERRQHDDIMVKTFSSWTYQGSLQGKVARRYRKTCRLVLQACCRGVVRIDSFGEGDVRRRDAHGNGRDSRRVFR